MLALTYFFSKVCGDYLLSRMDITSCISYRNFASCMGDSRLLNKVDAYIQEHLLQISEEEEFLKLPRLKVRSTNLETNLYHLVLGAQNLCSYKKVMVMKMIF
jgi:hypothetical protein